MWSQQYVGKINGIANKNVVFGGNFNFFFNAKLEAQGSNPVLKKNIFSGNNTN